MFSCTTKSASLSPGVYIQGWLYNIINKKPIKFVYSYSRLGHVIVDSASDEQEISNWLCDFIGQVNNVLCYFQKLQASVKYRLFCSYCTIFYGCELSNLSCSKLLDFCAKWRMGIRKVWNLPYDTHTFILPLLVFTSFRWDL